MPLLLRRGGDGEDGGEADARRGARGVDMDKGRREEVGSGNGEWVVVAIKFSSGVGALFSRTCRCNVAGDAASAASAAAAAARNATARDGRRRGGDADALESEWRRWGGDIGSGSVDGPAVISRSRSRCSRSRCSTARREYM